jgi:hypothetical protein
MSRAEAMVKLLSLPDPKGLPARRHVPRYAGDPKRRDSAKRDLARAYLEYKLAAYWNADFSERDVIAVRRHPLRVVARRRFGVR